jgi:modulator of FtsH protease
MIERQTDTVRVATSPAVDAVEINSVLRNTYLLLGMTLAFSASMAWFAMAINAPYLGLWTLLGWFGLLFAIHKTANSAWGLFWVFAFTGFLGFTIGRRLDPR